MTDSEKPVPAHQQIAKIICNCVQDVKFAEGRVWPQYLNEAKRIFDLVDQSISHRVKPSSWLPVSTNPPPQDGTWIALCNFAEDLETGDWGFHDGPYTARWHDFRWRDANNEEVDGCEYWSLIAKPERPQ